MQDIHITYNQLLLYIGIANFILGLLLGTLPLIAGFKLNNRKYGYYGFFASILGGSLLGLFASYPIAAAFIWLICRKETGVPEID